MKIVADDKIHFLEGVFEPFAEVKYLPGPAIKKRDVQDADVLIVRTRTHCEKSLLSGTTVKYVASATIGTNHLDIAWLKSAGIEWDNAPGCNAGSVCQYIASILALLINDGLKPEETTIGIVGVGVIGVKVEKMAKILGFKVILNDPPRARREQPDDQSSPITSFADYNNVLEESDIILYSPTLSFAGVDASYHLFDFDTLDKIKQGAIIINISRGEVVSDHALLKGLETGKISKVALDVWENEPDITMELLEKAWVATPHIAGFSADGKSNGTIMSVRNVSRFFNLGLDDWKPRSIPLPECTTIKIDAIDKKPYQVAAEAFLKTYNIMEDDTRLRANPADFELQRDNYPLRREFHAWNVELLQDNSCREMLKSLGFNVL